MAAVQLDKPAGATNAPGNTEPQDGNHHTKDGKEQVPDDVMLHLELKVFFKEDGSMRQFLPIESNGCLSGSSFMPGALKSCGYCYLHELSFHLYQNQEVRAIHISIL